jgi:4-diphosphocytidyl-2-C-methyl-D-erythritol kinase
VALLALRELWGLSIGLEELHRLAAELGSDVPFFLRGGRALCEGRGDVVSPLPDAPGLHLVLVMPGRAVSTGRVYGRAESGLTESGAGSNNVLEALAEGDLGMLGRVMRNDLQGPALELHAKLREDWRYLNNFCGLNDAAGCLLSGSGSSFFLIARGADQATHFARLLRSEMGVPCGAAHSLPAWGGDLAALSI